MRYLPGILLLLLIAAACNTRHENKEKQVLAKDSLVNKVETKEVEKPDSLHGLELSVMPGKDSKNDKKVLAIFLSLKEIKALRYYSDSHKDKGLKFSWMTSEPDSTHTDYIFQAGFNSDIRFETHYWIHIDPETLKVKFLDMLTDSLYSPADFRKLKS